MLQADETLPEVKAAPAPWQLTGRGWIVLMKFPAAFLDDARFLPAALRGKRHGRHAVIMAVDYATSPVGPYQELMYIPGRFDFTEARRHSITRIFVSTMASVVNGRRNWGIPKDRCDFSCTQENDGSTLFSARLDHHRFAQLRFRQQGPKLPFSTTLIPANFGCLSQIHNGTQFTCRPRASGRIQHARACTLYGDGELFPDLGRGQVTACVAVTKFKMHFPVATITRVYKQGAELHD